MNTHAVTFVDQHGKRHVCNDVHAVDQIEAVKVAALRLSVKYDAYGCRPDAAAEWLLPGARTKKGRPRSDLLLNVQTEKPPASALSPTRVHESTDHVDARIAETPSAINARAEVITEAPAAPSMEELADPDRIAAIHAKWRAKVQRTCCSFGACGKLNYTGAKLDQRHNIGRYFCREHWNATWAEVWAADEAHGGPPAESKVNFVGRPNRRAEPSLF